MDQNVIYTCKIIGKSSKRAKGVKKCVTKKNLRFSDYKECLMNHKKIMRSQQVFKSERHVVSTIQVKCLI